MALTVGSVARPGYSTAPYSGRGPTADGRSKPETVAIGIDGASAGTSYAAPRASALAARLLAQNPSMSVEQLKAEIRAHSAPLGGRRNARAEPATWIDSTDFE
jgi:hypothetical protein